METKGIELPANSGQKRHFQEPSAQNPAHAGTDDADLAWLIDAWPGLDETTRKAILRLANKKQIDGAIDCQLK